MAYSNLKTNTHTKKKKKKIQLVIVFNSKQVWYIVLAGTRNSYVGPPRMIDPMTQRTRIERSYHGATSRTSQRTSHLLFQLF